MQPFFQKFYRVFVWGRGAALTAQKYAIPTCDRVDLCADMCYNLLIGPENTDKRTLLQEKENKNGKYSK